jgi:hypothetical protein
LKDHFSTHTTGVIMFRFLCPAAMRSHFVCWGLVAAIFVCLAGGGCCSDCNLRGDNFQDDSLAATGRAMRNPDKDSEALGVSTKSRQVERDLGVP